MSGAQMTARQVTNLKRDRHPLMRETFYKYASSRSEHPLVDKHDIESALEAWHMYWVAPGVAFHTLEFRDLVRICRIRLVAYRFLDRFHVRTSVYASSLWTA
jgi:hypothetical protein